MFSRDGIHLPCVGVEREANSENAGVLVFLELGDADCIAPELLLNHAQWKVALLHVEDLRRPAKPL